MNIVCTKYGKLYDYSYVNHLYGMIKKHSKLDFKFWCQTENPDGINSEISIIPIASVDPKSTRYHKISLIENQTLKGKCVSFDLDIIINKNIDHYLTHESSKLILLYANYKTLEEVKHNNAHRKIFKDSMINSSIFSWIAGSENVKEILRSHYNLKIDTHLGSFDRFLFWRCSKYISVFKFDDYCSYFKHGYHPDKTFCAFNSHRNKQDLKKFWC
jgi:hypothetical protein